jgi:hypothetical protein
MPAPALGAPERMPRPSGFLVPASTPRRTELVAVAALAALLLHVLFAQLTLVLAIIFTAVDRLARWRPQWLAVPAAAGLIWALAIGAGRAAAGFTAGPGRAAAYLASAVGHPTALVHLSRGFAGLPGWLPGQLPLALIAGSAEAALAGAVWRLRRSRAGAPVTARPGLAVAVRRRAARSALARGEVLTLSGVSLGLDPATGRRASITWPEAERGVLITGASEAALAACGGALALAAIRRRKAVIMIDLTDGRDIAGRLPAACAAAGAPLLAFGGAGQRSYEPYRGGHPARAASLVAAMIDWSAVSDVRRRACAAYLADACAVVAAAPADPRLPLLDDLAGLLQPDALRARAGLVPGYHPRREMLLDRADVSAKVLAGDPGATRAAAEQLTRVRGSALGHWLCPARPQAPAISLGPAMRERAVVTFTLDQAVHGRSAAMIAALAVADLLAILAELQAMAVRTDCLVWISGCEALPAARLAQLARRGRQAGTAVLLTTTSAAAAAALAADTGVVVTRGPADPVVAQQMAALADPPARPAAPADGAPPAGAGPLGLKGSQQAGTGGPAGRSPDALALLVTGTPGRYLPACEAVPVAERPATASRLTQALQPGRAR